MQPLQLLERMLERMFKEELEDLDGMASKQCQQRAVWSHPEARLFQACA